MTAIRRTWWERGGRLTCAGLHELRRRLEDPSACEKGLRLRAEGCLSSRREGQLVVG